MGEEAAKKILTSQLDILPNVMEKTTPNQAEKTIINYSFATPSDASGNLGKTKEDSKMLKRYILNYIFFIEFASIYSRLNIYIFLLSLILCVKYFTQSTISTINEDDFRCDFNNSQKYLYKSKGSG